MMKVFRITPTEPYTGGAAYVAANDVEEAIKTFREEEYRDYEYNYGNCTCNHVSNMSYDIDRPFVIFDDLYLE
jgi:hypothetical protein